LDELRIQNERLQTKILILEAEVADAAKLNQQLIHDLKEREEEICSLVCIFVFLKKS
jgi:hypothetical protein